MIPPILTMTVFACLLYLLKFSLGQLEGVERVILGYTGGGKQTPTFNKIHDHTEALLVEFLDKLFVDVVNVLNEACCS